MAGEKKFADFYQEVKLENPVRFRLDCPERAQKALDLVQKGEAEGYKEVCRMMAFGIIPQCPRTDEEKLCADILHEAFQIATKTPWYGKGFTPKEHLPNGADATLKRIRPI